MLRKNQTQEDLDEARSSLSFSLASSRTSFSKTLLVTAVHESIPLISKSVHVIGPA